MDAMTELLLTALKHWDRWDGTDTIGERDEELLRELIDGLCDGSIKLLHLTAFGNHGTTAGSPSVLIGEEERWRRVVSSEEFYKRATGE